MLQFGRCHDTGFRQESTGHLGDIWACLNHGGAGIGYVTGEGVFGWGIGGGLAVGVEETEAGVTVIGHLPDYILEAELEGANHLFIDFVEWDAMSPAEQLAAEQDFMFDAIERGDIFRLTTSIDDARVGSWLE